MRHHRLYLFVLYTLAVTFADDVQSANAQTTECPAPASCGDPLRYLMKPGKALTPEESRTLAEAMKNPSSVPPDPAYLACVQRQKTCAARTRQQEVQKIPDLEKEAEAGDQMAMAMLVESYAVPELLELPMQRNCSRAEYWAKKLGESGAHSERRPEDIYALQFAMQTFVTACKNPNPK